MNYVKNYDLDGLKLDFIDQFYLRKDSPAFCEGMDFKDVQEAADHLMHSVKTALAAVKPDIMIEFRQPYMGPRMRECGNMFRAADCPYSELTQRVRTIDLRLLSGGSAVHSDMLMWHPDDSDEAVSRQILAGIFSVMQFSVNLEKLPESKKRLLTHWIQFMIEQKELLLHAKLMPVEPQHLYPEVTAEKDNRAIVALYSAGRVVVCKKNWDSVIILNGTDAQHIYMRCEEAGNYALRILDCRGEEQELYIQHWETGVVYTASVNTGSSIYLRKREG